MRAKCGGRPAGDRPAQQRSQGDAASKMRKDLLNHSQVRDGCCEDGGGVGGAVSFDGNGAKVKEE